MKKKQPAHIAKIDAAKRPIALPTTRERQVVFSFRLFDPHQWASKYGEDCAFHLVAAKIRDYSRFTWGEIEQNKERDHPVQVCDMIRSAQEKLRSLKLDTFTSVWRFRFDGLHRLWGIRDVNTFYALWWDPEHAISPSKLKNT